MDSGKKSWSFVLSNLDQIESHSFTNHDNLLSLTAKNNQSHEWKFCWINPMYYCPVGRGGGGAVEYIDSFSAER